MTIIPSPDPRPVEADAGPWALGTQCFSESPGFYLALHKYLLEKLMSKQGNKQRINNAR